MIQSSFIEGDIFFKDSLHEIFDRLYPGKVIDRRVRPRFIGHGRRFQPMFRPGQAPGIGIHAAHRIHQDIIAAVTAEHIGQGIEDGSFFLVFVVRQKDIGQYLTAQEVQFFLTSNGKGRVQVNGIEIFANDVLTEGMKGRNVSRRQ